MDIWEPKEEYVDKPLTSLSRSRKFARVLTLILCAVLCLLISYFYLHSHQKTSEIYEQELRFTIIELQKSFLHDTINNLINRIDTERVNAVNLFKESTDARYHALLGIHTDSRSEYVELLFKELGLTDDMSDRTVKRTVLIWDDSNKIIYASPTINAEDLKTARQNTEEELANKRLVERHGVSCLFGYSNTVITDIVKASIAAQIHASGFEHDSYIWVNEVLNYDGGDNYAIRRVHPNLPETEGEYLSTSMQDIVGNHPYLVELDGIKKDGELFFNYYFKELDSEKISEKLSYAKLYPDFNWIIAMGVQHNVMDEHFLHASEELRRSAVKDILLLLAVLIASVIIFLVLLVIAENRRHRQDKTQLEIEVSFDELTGAKSRRFGIRYLEKLFADYVRSDHRLQVVLIFFDVDNFKCINDNYGHEVGDSVLIRTVHSILGTIRSTDELIRLGGDEFLGVFVGLREEDLAGFAEIIRKTVTEVECEVKHAALKLSISVGTARFLPGDVSYADALRRADEAMYASKSKGGNTVIIS